MKNEKWRWCDGLGVGGERCGFAYFMTLPAASREGRGIMVMCRWTFGMKDMKTVMR